MSKVRIITRLETFVDVDATVFGQWAAHRQLDSDCKTLCTEGYSVTMVPSGRCIGSYTGDLDEVSAFRIAKALSERIPNIEDWRKTTKEAKSAIRDVVDEILGPLYHDEDIDP